MTESTYTGPIDSHPDSHGLAVTLPEVSSPLGPCTSAAYPDVPYTAASPFAYPSACDPSLLTPISSVGSPPMQQRSRLSRGYTPTGSSQQPTPPASSRMGWNAPFDMSTPASQAGSPMTMHPSSVSEDPFPMSYVTADTKDQIPDPPEPYFGHFGVSAEGVKQEPAETRMPPYYHQVSGGVPPGALMGQHPYSMMHNHMHPMPSHIMSPDPSVYPHPPPRGGEMGPMQAYHPHPSPGATTSRAGFPHRIAKPPKTKAAGRRGKRTGDGLEGVLSRNSPEILDEPIQLRNDTPDQERFLLELRMQHGPSKGKNMWKEIADQFEQRFGKKSERAALQMMLTRLKAKYIIWSQRDLDLLKEVVLEDEAQRYKRLADKFTERGGGRGIGFNMTNIEAKLVEMGYEDFYMDPDTKIRPRKKLNDKRPANGKKRSRTMGNDILSNDELSIVNSMSFSDEQADELIEQIESRNQAHAPETSMEVDEDVMKMEDEQLQGAPGVAGDTQQSERVARQACEELMKSHIPNEHRYYGQNRGTPGPM